MRRGLESWPADVALVVSTADGPSRLKTQFHIGFDLLAQGLGFTGEDQNRLAAQGIDDGNIPVDAMRVFFGVLHAKGAPIPSATALERLRRSQVERD